MSCGKWPKFVLFLQDPVHVERFQKYFGLEFVNNAAGDTKDSLPNARQLKSEQYRINNYFWYYLFSFGSKLGYEFFYAFSFSCCYWNLDSYVCRRLILLWGLLMYVGQALKDIIKWPRPQGPNIIVLEPEYSLEYGMPSTHAILSLSIPANLFVILMDRYEISTPFFLICASCWLLLICSSRVYLGMHSLLDILAGLGLTSILLVLVLPSASQIDQFLLRSPLSPLIVLSTVITLAMIYPKTNPLSPSRGDTCTIIAASAGFVIGSWFNYQLGVFHDLPSLSLPFKINYPSAHELFFLLLRTLIGLIMISVVRLISKQIITNILKLLTKVDVSQPQWKHSKMVEVPTKLFVYLWVGYAISFLIPALFRFLGIARNSMYLEA